MCFADWDRLEGCVEKDSEAAFGLSRTEPTSPSTRRRGRWCLRGNGVSRDTKPNWGPEGGFTEQGRETVKQRHNLFIFVQFYD